MKRGLALSLVVMALAAWGVRASHAATATLSLDIYYSDPDSDHIPEPGSAGTWQLVARTSTGDNRGISGVDTQLTGVANSVGAAGASLLAPRGAATVGGVAGTAGFQTTYDAKNWGQDQDGVATTLDALIAQVPVGTPNQGLFYDVGNPAAGNIKGSGDAGAGQPAVTGLASAVAWNYDDTLGDRLGDNNANNNNGAYQRGVLLAFGRFGAGQAPALVAGQTAVNVFTALGSQATAPLVGTIDAATVAIETRNNSTIRQADFNIDGVVDGADIGALIGGFDGTATQDRLWQQGDATGDKRVDGADIGQLIGNFQGDPGPVPAGSAKAEYNPATGEIIVSVNGIANWYVESLNSALTGAEPTIPSVVGSLVTNNDARVGQGSFGVPLQYTDQNLGAVCTTGQPQGSLVLKYSVGLGTDEITGEVLFVPEPTTVALVGLAGLALVAVRRRAA